MSPEKIKLEVAPQTPLNKVDKTATVCLKSEFFITHNIKIMSDFFDKIRLIMNILISKFNNIQKFVLT